MTTRLAMAVGLLVVLLAQAFGLVRFWQEDPLQSLTVTGKKESRAASLPEGKQSLQPTQPATPPDLNQGYIFSAERSLAAGGGKGGQAQKAAVGIDKIHYSGAIITDTNPRALLSYSQGGLSDSPGGNPDGSQKQGFLRVAIGDTVDGYKVTEILAEKITFSRDGQQITKLLYDKAKTRVQEPPSLASRGQSGQALAAPPVPQAPGQKVQPVLAPWPGVPPTKVAEPAQIPTLRKQLQPQVPPPPSDEELRQRPLRKRPEPPPS